MITIFDNLWRLNSVYILFVFALLVIIASSYWYLKITYEFWLNQGLNGPKPLLLLGNLLDQLLNSTAYVDINNMKKYGRVFGTYFGTKPVLHVVDNDMAKLILVKHFNSFLNRRSLNIFHPVINASLVYSRDDQWKRVRLITSTAFTSGKMKKLYGLMKKCVQDFTDHLEQITDHTKSFDLIKIYGNLTMDVIVSCGFATQTNAAKDPNNEFTRMAYKALNHKWYAIPAALLLQRWLNDWLGIKSVYVQEPNEWLIDFVRHMIKKKIATVSKDCDLLQVLIDANADDSNSNEKENISESQFIQQASNVLNPSMVKKRLTEDEIIAQSWVLLMAGYETTTKVFAYMSHELAFNQDVQDRLYNELISSMDSDGEIDYDTLQALPYLDACICETLRMFPPAVRLERECNSDVVLGETGIKMKKGQIVEILVYAMHHNKDYFPDPDKYNPDRFLPENRHRILPFTYMPFGNGPRHCIAMRFALMEIKLAMAHILTKFRLTKINGMESTIKFIPNPFILTPKSLRVGIEKRY